MDDGCVGADAGNGIEGETAEMRRLRAQGVEVVGGGDFVEGVRGGGGIGGGELGFEPGEVGAEGGAVADVAGAHAGDFGGVLEGFRVPDWGAQGVDMGVAAKAEGERPGGFSGDGVFSRGGAGGGRGGVGNFFAEEGDVGEEGGVGADVDFVVEVGEDVGGEFVGVDVEGGGGGGDDGVGEEDGVVGDAVGILLESYHTHRRPSNARLTRFPSG